MITQWLHRLPRISCVRIEDFHAMLILIFVQEVEGYLVICNFLDTFDNSIGICGIPIVFTWRSSLLDHILALGPCCALKRFALKHSLNFLQFALVLFLNPHILAVRLVLHSLEHGFVLVLPLRVLFENLSLLLYLNMIIGQASAENSDFFLCQLYLTLQSLNTGSDICHSLFGTLTCSFNISLILGDHFVHLTESQCEHSVIIGFLFLFVLWATRSSSRRIVLKEA